MKMWKEGLRTAGGMMVVITVLCGILYPLLVTGAGQLFFKDKANGQIIEVDGVKYGSGLLAQEFTGEEYLWGRVMSANTETYYDEAGNPLYYSGPSNTSPAGEAFNDTIETRAAAMKIANPDAEGAVPVELVTNSGSGLDPSISVKAAQYQVPRIAAARGITEEEVEAIIRTYTTSKFLGFLGEETVNVLKVNLALNGILPAK